MNEAIVQLAIMCLSGTAIFLTNYPKEEVKKFACFFGIAGQPFWLYTSFTNDQWGIFSLALFYLGSWLMGLSAYWLKPVYASKIKPQKTKGLGD